MKLSENALILFKNGYNCSQAVFTSYAVTQSVDKDTAMSISRGFGAGMGRLQETCGAVTGAYMAIGLSKKKSSPEADENHIKEETYAAVREFNEEFKKIHGTTNCMKLLGGCNFFTEEGKKFFKDNNLMENKCFLYVKDASEILEKLIL